MKLRLSILTQRKYVTIQNGGKCNEYKVREKLTYLLCVVLVRKRTIPTEQPQLAGEVSAKFCG
jgi:hypothetical protein